MKIKIINFLFALSFLLASCTFDASNKDQTTSESKIDPSYTGYQFFPDTSVITGELKVEMFYGAPNYGECPDTDAKEYAYILYLDSAIDVRNFEGEKQLEKGNEMVDEDVEYSVLGVKKVQLAPPTEMKLSQYKNKQLKVKGTFFGKKTGHHHTDVLLSVLEVTDL